MNRLKVAPIVFLLVASVAPAQVVTVTRIADTSTVAPGGTATYTSFGLFPSIDGSTVGFYGTAGGTSSIYTSTGGTISTLVPAAAPIPSGTGNFTTYNQSFRY